MRLLSAIWGRKPWATAAVMVVMLVMIGLQYTVHGLAGQLMRQPGALHDGQWWRVFTALFIQSSGLEQIVGTCALWPVSARSLRGARPQPLAAGLLRQWHCRQQPRRGGWSRHGGGSSVAICGLIGALAAICLLRGGKFGPDLGPDLGEDPKRLRWTALAIPAAGAFLCAIANNHGAGLLTGCVLGLVVATVLPGSLRLGSAENMTNGHTDTDRCLPAHT
ncbi:hypothetical protein GXW82_35745 [Streptacidiphilus sp. 4-A2]|nr:hypothetical protein [Streptacidiphilus sp. 4-A2]